jgi:hypothetical protein
MMTTMIPRAGLTALLADAGIVDVDIDRAIADEHVRSAAYRRVVSVAAASRRRDRDQALVATLLRDPVEMVAKTAIVYLVDSIAMKVTCPADFQQWSTGLLSEIDLLKTEASRRFLHDRIQDWMHYLAIGAGYLPTPVELADVTAWMQRRIAEESCSPPVLALLVEYGRSKKVRNIARNRARSREVNIDA